MMSDNNYVRSFLLVYSLGRFARLRSTRGRESTHRLVLYITIIIMINIA